MEKDNISDLLNTFNNILNNSPTSTSQSDKTSNSNNSLNITPEMITQLANNIKNQSFKSNSTTNTDLNLATNITSNSSSSDNNFENTPKLDLETILIFKKIMEAFNQKDDKRSNLLCSLKPYLRESRQKKIDQYVNLFKISGITKILKQEKGDLK